MNKKASLVFAMALIGLGLPFYFWILNWLVPILQLGNLFKSLLFITIVLVITTALVPDAPGWRRQVHRFTAFSMAIMYVPLVGLIANAPQISYVSHVIGTVCLIYMLISFVLVAVLGKAKHQYLVYQTLYIVAMQIAVLSAAYIR